MPSREIPLEISLGHQPDRFSAKHLLFDKRKSRRRFSLPQDSLISIVQQSGSFVNARPILIQGDLSAKALRRLLKRSRECVAVLKNRSNQSPKGLSLMR